MANVLLYERPSSSQLFRKVITTVHGSSTIIGVSSYRGSSDIWSGEYIYQRKYDALNRECIEAMDDVICRDRSLSLMDRSRAERIVRRFWNGAELLFKQNNFDYFYTLSVDCYEIDILLRLAKQYGAIAVSWIGTFLNGYARVTLRGERCAIGRNVSSDEAESVAGQLLDKLYLPASETSNVKKGKKDVLHFYGRRKLIELLYNPLQKVIKRDPDNLMYNIHTFPNIRYKDLYVSDYDSLFTPLNSIRIDRANVIYYPMHLIPEATTSYWCRDVIRPDNGGNINAYAEFVKRFIKEADKGIHFLIKEHPAMFGRRPMAFYRELQSIENVDVIHPMVRSNDLLEYVDNVLVDDGTVGIEGLLRGKRILSLEENYYSSLHSNVDVVSRVTKEELMRPLSAVDPIAFVAALLADTFPSDYSNGKNQNSCAVDSIAAGVEMYLESLGGSN